MDSRRNLGLDEAVHHAEAAFVAANPGSAAAHERAVSAMPGGNTRTVLHYSPFPLAFAKGLDSILTDVDGHVYTDFLGEYTAGLFGHSNAVILGAVKRALEDGFVMGGPTCIESAFAAAVCTRFPTMQQVRFCNSGTEANLLAFGAARAWTGRDTFIVLEGCYHGGVLSFGSNNPINAPYKVRKIRLNDIYGACAAIREVGDQLAAVMLEPMLGGGGGFTATPEFMAALRTETSAQGALLMVDEVMTSRLAPGGLHHALGVEVDLMTLGKYVGGGMSFGAVGGRHDIMERFDPRRADAWGHAGTFNNNVATMAGGLAALTEVLTDAVLADLNSRGDRLREKLNQAAREAEVPLIATGRGSILTYHFSDRPAAAPHELPQVPVGLRVIAHLGLIERGFYSSRRGFLSLSLPLTDADVDAFVAATADMLTQNAVLIRSAVAEAA